MKAQGKTFLTDRGDEGGSIRWFVIEDNQTFYRQVDAELIITDCKQAVVLEFDMDSNKDLPKRLAKVDTLIAELGRFREALVLSELKPKKFYY